MDTYDLLIVGAGPAGLSAAIAARRYGANTILVDDNLFPGGQLMKQTHKFFGSKEHYAGRRGMAIGRELLSEAEKSGCTVSLGTRVYTAVNKEGAFVAGCIRQGKSYFIKAGAVILATGASENSLAFPGWTLPGVITAGAAQTMVNLHRVLPGKRLLMVGAGNVGLIVAYQMLQAGMEVAALIEALPRVGGYEVHANKLKRAGVPILLSHTIVKAEGNGCVETATIAEVDSSFNPAAGTARELKVDTVCLAVGLSPLYQLARLMGAEIEYSREKGGYVLRCDRHMGTSVAGLFAAGDLAGIEEASIAIEEGKIAGLSSSVYLGKASEKEVSEVRDAALKNLAALRNERDLIPEPALERKAGRPGGSKKSSVQVMLDCTQQIPCNPCEAACPTGAIKIGSCIRSTPVVSQELCSGCCSCVAACPGLACFVADHGYNETEASFAFAYEYHPLPVKGSEVEAVDRNGVFVCPARVLEVRRHKDRTAVIRICVPREKVMEVRGINPGKVPVM